MTEKPPVLVVDDDAKLREFLCRALRVDGYPAESVAKAEDAEALLTNREMAVLVADVFLKGINGVELLKRVLKTHPSLQVVLMGRQVPTFTVVNGMKQGAFDFLEKPIDVDHFLLVLEKAVGHFRLTEENQALRRVCNLRDRMPDDMVAVSAVMLELLKTLELVSPTDLTVLIEGESGVGKELVANRIHRLSPRHDKSFVAVNCGAIQENLLESELFGHQKGAFTGATQDHKGLFEVADRGTLFLDEIGEMSLDLQVKLLRVLERSEFRRVGSNKLVRVDVRVVAATNKTLMNEVERGRFREDLFYRLNVIHLEVPPLRDRSDDIPALVETFLAAQRPKGLPLRRLDEDAITALKKYHWPGNVRELRNILERCMILSRGEVITVADLPAQLREATRSKAAEEGAAEGFDIMTPLSEVERRHIVRVLESQGGNKVQTARILGINVKTLYNKLKSYEKDQVS